MIHVIEVDKGLFDIINAFQNRYPSSTEVNGEYYFVDGDEIIFVSNDECSDKFKVLSYETNKNRTHVEFY